MVIDRIFVGLFSVTVVSFKPFNCLSFTSEVFLKCNDFHPFYSIKFYLLQVRIYHKTANIKVSQIYLEV